MITTIMSLFDAVIHIVEADAVCGGVAVTPGMAVAEYVAASGLDAADALRALQRCDDSGAVRVELPCLVQNAPKGFPENNSVFDAQPELSDIAGYAREWDDYPEYNDYMRPDSPAHQRKMFQGEIYAELLASEIDALDSGAGVLDAGCGVGRIAPHLARSGARLVLVDVSQPALKAAWRVLAECGVRGYDLHCRHAANLDVFEDNAFDLVLALELLCYLDAPAAAMDALARVCRPGGVVALSVENKPGAALGSDMGLEQLEILSRSGTLHVPGFAFTRYYTRDAAAALAENAGLAVSRVHACHFIVDGPFHALASESALFDPQRRARFHAAERLCRGHDVLSRLARAWLVVARKPV